MMTIIIPFDPKQIEDDDLLAVMALANDNVDLGKDTHDATIDLDTLDIDELEGLTKIAAVASNDAGIISALAIELEARTNPDAEKTTACDPAIIAEVTPVEPKANAA